MNYELFEEKDTTAPKSDTTRSRLQLRLEKEALRTLSGSEMKMVAGGCRTTAGACNVTNSN